MIRLLPICLAGCLLLAAPALADPPPATIDFSILPDTGVHARYVDRLDFRTCEIRNRDPWDPRCSGWRPVQHGSRLPIQGLFCVYARWNDNRVYRGSVEMLRNQATFTYKVDPRRDKGNCI